MEGPAADVLEVAAVAGFLLGGPALDGGGAGRLLCLGSGGIMCGSGFDGAFGSLDTTTFGGGRDGGVSESESESEDESICWYPVVVEEEARALPAGFLAWERRRSTLLRT